MKAIKKGLFVANIAIIAFSLIVVVLAASFVEMPELVFDLGFALMSSIFIFVVYGHKLWSTPSKSFVYTTYLN